MRLLGMNVVLSPQQVVSCDNTCYGCSGGWSEHAYDYVMQASALLIAVGRMAANAGQRKSKRLENTLGRRH
eukprot:scaffold295_cov257-Pinguiococcus_pyrenoidosus.AAC.14